MASRLQAGSTGPRAGRLASAAFDCQRIWVSLSRFAQTDATVVETMAGGWATAATRHANLASATSESELSQLLGDARAETRVVKTKNQEMTMADAWTLRDAFIDELRVAYDAEKQLTRFLLTMAKAAKSPGLRAHFEKHLDETRAQLVRLEHVFETLDERARGKQSDGIAGIIGEGKTLLQGDAEKITRDACLIASGKRVEHYEIAVYATLVSWARAMSFNAAADVLQQILEEERAADATLTALAEDGINQGAADAAYPDSDSEADSVVPVTGRHDALKRRSVALKVS